MTAEAIVFGPGDMTVAHKSGEFVGVKDLERCVGYLVELMKRLCVTRFLCLQAYATLVLSFRDEAGIFLLGSKV